MSSVKSITTTGDLNAKYILVIAFLIVIAIVGQQFYSEYSLASLSKPTNKKKKLVK